MRTLKVNNWLLASVALVLSCLLTSRAGATFYEGIVLGDGPSHYYRLGESSGTTAVNLANPGVNNGTYVGDYTQGEPGALFGDSDTSVNFATGATAGYVDVGSLGATTTQFTVEFWMNTDILDNPRNPFSTSGAAGGNEGMRFEENAAGLFNVRVGDDGGAPQSAVTLTNPLTAAQWYHVATTFDTTTNRIQGYLNGSQIFNQIHGNAMASMLNDVEIGRGFSTGADRFWDGDIDEVAIYSRILDPSEILFHYDVGVGNILPPPVPEPSTSLLLGLGALGLVRHTRRRRRRA